VTEPSLSRGSELLDYYQRFGPTAIGLNIEELEAQNKRIAIARHLSAL